jgi:hypothetical protein
MVILRCCHVGFEQGGSDDAVIGEDGGLVRVSSEAGEVVEAVAARELAECSVGDETRFEDLRGEKGLRKLEMSLSKA